MPTDWQALRAEFVNGRESVHRCAAHFGELGDDVLAEIQTVDAAQAFAFEDAPASSIAGCPVQFVVELLEVEVLLVGE